MSNIVYLISTQYLKSHSVINGNVADELLNNSIEEAQTIYLQQILGTKLYEKILNLVDTGEIALPVNAEYKRLLDSHIQKVLSYRATELAIPYLMVKLVNKGTQSQNSDWSNSSDLKSVQYLRDDVVNRAEFYEQRLIDYLCDNAGKFPEYHSNRGHDLRHNKNAFFSGIVFDNDGGCCFRS